MEMIKVEGGIAVFLSEHSGDGCVLEFIVEEDPLVVESDHSFDTFLRFFLSDMEEVVWGKESSVGIGFGLVVVLCFFCGSEGVGVGDVKWNVFRFLGGNGCSFAATLASSINGNDVERGCGSGLILRRVGCKWKSFMVDLDPEDRVFIINWDHDCFMVDVDGIKGLSWSPGSPVIHDVEMPSSDEGAEEVEMIVVGVHANENNPIVGAKGEDGRGGES